MIYIYGLYSTDENNIRYVGKTNNLQKRLKEHILAAKRNRKTHRDNWILKNLKENNNINIKLLEECSNENWQEKEKYWISKIENLTNHTEGGECGHGYVYNITYDEAKEIVKTLNIKSKTEWFKYVKDKLIILPYSPNNHFKNKGWKGWGDFLSTDRKQDNLIAKNYLSYEEAKKYIKDNNLNINTIEEWKHYIKNIKNIKNNKFIPNKPNRFYKNKGWISWGDFLGTGRIANQNRKFVDYDTAKTIVKQFGFINRESYFKHIDEIKKLNIPTNPDKKYKNNGWTNWKNFLN